jgi:hypothetical protein
MHSPGIGISRDDGQNREEALVWRGAMQLGQPGVGLAKAVLREGGCDEAVGGPKHLEGKGSAIAQRQLAVAQHAEVVDGMKP